MIPTTIPIVGSSRPRSPSSARSAASIAYATDETGSAITANAKAKNKTAFLRRVTERTAAESVAATRASSGRPRGRGPGSRSHLTFTDEVSQRRLCLELQGAASRSNIERRRGRITQ